MPDLILSHANVHRLGRRDATAEAMAIEDGRIVAVGSNDRILPLAGPAARVVNLNGATVLPGFYDAHCHILHYGLDLEMVDLSSPPVTDIEGIVRLLAERAEGLGDLSNAWVLGRGYDQNKLAEGRHPTRQDLDRVGGGKPYVLITQTSGHALTANSRVLTRAGIHRRTSDPAGGTIVRDADGEPTGVLLENAMDLAYAVLPEQTHGERVAALERAGEALHRWGITSVSDASTGLSEIAAYRDAAAAGRLTVRCALMVLLPQLIDGDRYLAPHELTDGNESPFVRIGPAKLFSDGALTTRTALLREPFADDPQNFGTAMWETDRLDAMILGAHVAGWQIAAHAIGDRAIDLCLDAYEAALRRHPRYDARHRIEHAMLLWDDQVERMARLGILPVYQPEFISALGDAYIAGLGRARADRLMPYRATAQAGLPLIFSSDLPVVPGNPLTGLRAAVERRTPRGEVLDPGQCVTVLDALRAYTHGGAYSVYAEDERGEVAPGQMADLVVLTDDPTRLPPDEWADAIAVRATLVGGRIVHGAIED